MARRLVHDGGRKAVAIAVAALWLPYLSMRCTDNPATHVGCHPLPQAAQAGADHHHAHEAAGAHGDTQHGPRPTSHACCSPLGKCSISAAFGGGLDLAAAPAAPMRVIAAAAPVPDSFAYAPRPIRASHDPPRYLRHAALLI